MDYNYATCDTPLPAYSPPKPATPEQLERELKLFRRKKIRQIIKRYVNLLFNMGRNSSWRLMEELAVIGFLKQHSPVSPEITIDDDLNFYIDFQYALWELETHLRDAFALRYIWNRKDREIARQLGCTRRTILRWADLINDRLYDSLRDYFENEEKSLLDILLCRF